MTQEEWSRRINKSEKYIGAVECGRISPPYHVLKEIVNALDIDGNALFYETTNNELSNIAGIYIRKMDISAQKLAVEVLRVIANSCFNKTTEKNHSQNKEEIQSRKDFSHKRAKPWFDVVLLDQLLLISEK